jgi:endonuclease-3
MSKKAVRRRIRRKPLEPLETRKPRARRILAALRKTFPDARCALNHRSPMELLVAVILSAQCTDEKVNEVTAALFAAHRTPGDFAKLRAASLEKRIYSTGFFRNKARSIIGTAQAICERFDGRVPQNMEDLLTLPGVARKTANVVLSTAFGIDEGIVVDTHVKRLADRLGLSNEIDPVKIERQLMEVVPRRDWGAFGFLFQSHGRRYCMARKPNCPQCPVAKLCPWPDKTVES